MVYIYFEESKHQPRNCFQDEYYYVTRTRRRRVPVVYDRWNSNREANAGHYDATDDKFHGWKETRPSKRRQFWNISEDYKKKMKKRVDVRVVKLDYSYSLEVKAILTNQKSIIVNSIDLLPALNRNLGYLTFLDNGDSNQEDIRQNYPVFVSKNGYVNTEDTPRVTFETFTERINNTLKKYTYWLSTYKGMIAVKLDTKFADKIFLLRVKDS